MSKTTVKQLREILKQNKKENIKAEYNGLLLEIRQYLPITEKITLIKSIFESAIDRDNGLHILNKNSLDIAYRILLVQTYVPNLTLPKNTIEAYDLLCESGLYDFIYENIPTTELIDIEVGLKNHIETERDEYEQRNTIQYIIKDLLSGLIDKLPSKEEAEEFVKMASKEIEGFDPNKMEFVKSFLNWNNGVDK